MQARVNQVQIAETGPRTENVNLTRPKPNSRHASNAGRPWLWLALLAGLAVAAGLLALARPAPSPTYHGRTLETWFDDHTLGYLTLHKGMPAGWWGGPSSSTYVTVQNGMPGAPNGVPTEALQAFLERGGEAMPYLARVARRGPNFLTRPYEKLYKSLPNSFKSVLPPAKSAEYYRARQLKALSLLGTIAYCEGRPHPWPSRHIEGEDDIALAAVVTCLSDEDGRVRSIAAAALACLHEKAVPALPELIKLLPDPAANYEAVNALGCFGASASNAVPILHQMLGKSGDTLDPIIIRVLGEIGPPAAVTLSSLVPLLNDQDDWGARAAALAIFGIGQTPAEALPALKRLTNGSVIVQARQCAALALWNSDRGNSDLITCISNQLWELPSLGLYHVRAGNLDHSASNLVPVLCSLTNKDPQLTRGVADLVQNIQGR